MRVDESDYSPALEVAIKFSDRRSSTADEMKRDVESISPDCNRATRSSPAGFDMIPVGINLESSAPSDGRLAKGSGSTSLWMITANAPADAAFRTLRL